MMYMMASCEEKLQELKTALLDAVTVPIGVARAVVRLENLLKDIVQSIDLNDMPYAFGARYDPGRGCLPGTQESFLRNICDILDNPDKDTPRVCLLTGVAGSGKSAVAHSIARLYDERKRLGSSFFFARADVASRNPKTLFRNIARDLSDLDPHYKSALWEVVKDSSALRTTPCPLEQLEKFIIEPSKALHPIGPLVIVIDALDESGDWDSRKVLLRTISQKIANDSLPTHLRFLITARAEEDIIAALPPGPRIVRKLMDDIPEEDVDRDIERFIQNALQQHFDFESSDLDKERCQDLVRHSQHSFQWASDACRFIDGPFSHGVYPLLRLDQILQATNTDSTGNRLLDPMYRTISSPLFTTDSQTLQRDFHVVMATILALEKPLPLASLSTLPDVDPNVQAIIDSLGSLLTGVFNEEPIRLVHTSFRDYLLDEARSGVFQ
ncbi:hypothetical protein OG21DRAFT_308221 [Imleria badia]|nr:hypothetical protein OG21DRAFT_308221 [Imleria badia]